jgi:RNA polymerase sigma factor (sigma-70 family)
VATQDCTAVDDDALLSEFVKNGDEGAFKTLAARHARWLYAAAFRQLRDRHLAEDATQAVFVLLWRRAGSVAGRRKVTGWLFRAVGYTARAMKRAERRRRKYESRAAALNRAPSDGPPPPQCRDVDAAVAALGDADRTAILLRYHRGLDFAQVARELGLSPAAARQRVSRAIGRLRAKLGTDVGAGVLASAVAYGTPPSATAFGERAAYAALGAARGVALAGGVEHALKGAVRLMAISKAKAIVALGALAAALVTSAVAVTTQRPANKPSDRAYALGLGEAIRQVQSVPAADRLEFLRRHSPPGERLDHPESAMIVKWQDGRASL